MNQKNSLGLNNCFLDLEIQLSYLKFGWMRQKNQNLMIPNALSLATSDKIIFHQ